VGLVFWMALHVHLQPGGWRPAYRRYRSPFPTVGGVAEAGEVDRRIQIPINARASVAATINAIT